MTRILKAKPIVDDMVEHYRDNIIPDIEERIQGKITLAVVMVGNNPASKKYVENKRKLCERVGIKMELYHFETATPAQVYTTITELNEHDDVHGIILQLPLPQELQPFERALIDAIAPEKDVDGLTSTSAAEMYTTNGNPRFIPCTPKGILDLLVLNDIPVVDQNIIIVGRGKLIGKPLAELLKSWNANVTTLHSKTSMEKMRDAFSRADIVITCCGKPRMFDTVTWNFLTQDNEKSITVIDCSTSEYELEDGTKIMSGDCYTDELLENCNNINAITTVFGCVGPMTVLSLISNTIHAASEGIEWNTETD